MRKSIPDLTFPELPYGTAQVPIDLRHHLYNGMSEVNVEIAREKLLSKTAGNPILDRLSIIIKIHQSLKTRIALGKPVTSIRNVCKSLRYFFAWCDRADRVANEASVVQDFRDWSEYLLSRTSRIGPPKITREESSARKLRGKRRKVVIKAQTANDMASFASRAISEALEMSRPLIRYTRLPGAAREERKPYDQSEKVTFDAASTFGATLLRICDQLTLENALGPLPVGMKLSSGIVLTEWCKLLPPEKVRSIQGQCSVGGRNAVLKTRKAWEEDGTIRTRYPVVNLRIECELLIFLSQTGMNLAQAHSLGRKKFTFQTKSHEVIVTASYKGRRGGVVQFKIFREYRAIFNRYLDWIEYFVPVDEDDRLFPFYYPCAIPPEDAPPNFSSTRLKFEKLGMEWVGPRKLRNLRVNWIKGYTGSDLIAAESAQHTTLTLQRIYAKPSHPIAAREIAQFHRANEASCAPPAPGDCAKGSAGPAPVADIPPGIAPPDCVNPSGCFYCAFHRDIDSKDYVWSLASYRRLKVLEIASHIPPSSGVRRAPPEVVVELVTRKIDAIADSSDIRRMWAEDVTDLLREGNYHPYWSASIKFMET